MKKLLIGLGATATALAMVPLFAAFEAHVINVTARIENALEVSTEHIDFGTVFPQEQIDKFFDVALSQSFLDEDRVDDIEYIIRQKPKCWNGDEQNPVYGTVTEGDDGLSFVCADENFVQLPLLCPYLSKHEITTDGTEQENDTGINAFHGDPNNWNMATTLAVQVTGRLAKSAQDIFDTWKIDFKVPCFAGQCAQDWDDFVIKAQGDMDDKASPGLYKPDANLEHQRFGCDLWLEVTTVSENKTDDGSQSIVQDNFNSYSDGSLLGQGSWTNYVNAGNYIVQGATVFEGAKAAFINSIGDSVITKAGAVLSDGRQTFYVRTQDRVNWGPYLDGNAQVRVTKGSWAGGTGIFAAVSFKSDGHVAFYNPVSDVYQDFATYNDGEWTLLEIEWRSSDKKARYRVNGSAWTAWLLFNGSGSFTDFDYVGFDFNQPSGAGGVYFDTLQ